MYDLASTERDMKSETKPEEKFVQSSPAASDVDAEAGNLDRPQRESGKDANGAYHSRAVVTHGGNANLNNSSSNYSFSSDLTDSDIDSVEGDYTVPRPKDASRAQYHASPITR